MKQEWKPDELRATSEEIRGAVMPKSITPDMVGGTLLGIVNALGEVVEVLGEIPREHVRVKVRGYDGTRGVSGAGATVWLDVFHSKGYPGVSLPRQELTCDEEGVVEFDVPHGYKYAIFSQLDGLGASFQLVEEAKSDVREIYLWLFPVGISHLYNVELTKETGQQRGCPVITGSFEGDMEATRAKWEWDAARGEHAEYYTYCGILVSTKDTSFVIGKDSKSKVGMTWGSGRVNCTLIPGISAINNNTADGKNTGDYTEAQNRARADMDGSLNTAKILDYAHNATAAGYCADHTGSHDERRWLPSAGQAYLMQLNRKAINRLMQEYLDEGLEGFDLLPDLAPDSTTSWSGSEYWLTSTIFDDLCVWIVNFNGYIISNYRNVDKDVRAVSAFYFDY